MQLPKASLEHWMRDYYFDCDYDLGSSGVYTYSLAEVKAITGLTEAEMEAVVFDDSLTRGSDGLRQAIANRYGNGDLNTVMCANGSNEMLYHLLMTLVEAGDEVIFLDTIYHALSAVPIAKQCNIKLWNMPASHAFKVDLDELRQLVTQKTKLIAVNFPHNPTGMTISQQQQDELIDIAASVGAYLVWDAAFDELAPEQPLKNPFLRYPNAISVGTLSKCYGLPGLRVGWCFASEEVQLKSVQLRDYTTLYVSPLIELIAQKAIEYGDVIVGNRIKEVAQNRRHLEDWIEEHAALVEWASPDGGVTSLVKLKTIDNVEQFCKQLAVKCDVMLVPGSCFGHPQYVRLGFGERTEKFVKGLQLVSDFLQKQSIAKAS